MENLIFGAFATLDGYREGDAANLGRTVYDRCTVVALCSAKAQNPACTVALLTNAPVPEPFAAHLKNGGVEIWDCPFTAYRVPAETNWALAYYKLCAMAWVLENRDFARAAMTAGVLTDFRLWNLDGAQTKGLHDRNGEILAHLHAAFSEPWQRNTWGWRLAKGVFVSFGERFDWPDAQAADRGALGRCRALSDQLAVLSDGTVVPCCLDHEGTLALGNLLCQDLPEILSAPLARTIREGFEKGIRAAPLCRRCGYAERFS